MQTFCPVEDFDQSAHVIDDKRLGKQIIESQQIFKSLSIPEYGWKSHPATKMWRGHRLSLVHYTRSFNEEWYRRRGKNHGGYINLLSLMDSLSIDLSERSMPSWWGNKDVHDSHKSNLIRKMPEHYQKFWPHMRNDLPYVWPV